MRGANLREFEELVLLSVRMNGVDASGATILARTFELPPAAVPPPKEDTP